MALTGPAAAAAAPPASLRLWPQGAPGGGGPQGPLAGDSYGIVRNVADPVLDIVVPARRNGAAVLVAAGGGYTQIAIADEARPAAAWLAERGVTAFVLTYRLPGKGWTAGPDAPLADAQRALRLIRSRAAAFGLDPARLGVMGFSSGGHLLGMAAMRSARPAYPARDAIDALSARPDFAALIYPVVTLRPPFDGTSSRRQLVGLAPTPATTREWSVETHVGRGAPATFLVHAEDDPVVDVENSRILAAACRAAAVPVELHTFARGNHGFALGRPGTPPAAWPRMAESWMRRLGVIPDEGDRVSAL